MAELAENQEQLQKRLLELTPTISPDLRETWEHAVAGALGVPPEPSGRDFGLVAEQYFVLIDCRNDLHQRELLARFRAEGLECQAKLC